MNLISNTILKGRVLCLFFVTVFVACNSPETEHKLEGEALGTTFHITYIGEEIDSLDTKIDSMIEVINHALSTYQKNSLITNFNTNSPAQQASNKNETDFLRDWYHLNKMVRMSQEISLKTFGAFDPSAATLFAIYDSAKKANVVMDSLRIQNALMHKGMDKIAYDSEGNLYKLDSLLTLNFNAIAKGYFVDILADYLESQDCQNYLVEVGGEVRVKGHNKMNELWTLGINIPRIDANPTDFFNVLQLENKAMATSGNYQNYYKIDGKIVGHTIDPRTGKAVISDLKSVSVIHHQCATADAYATACMVLGLEKSKKIIASDSSLSAYFIYEENNELKGLFMDATN